MKKLITICLCTLLISILGGCGDEDHITQKEAAKIAEGLTGGEVTYVETENVSDTRIAYKFTDSKGNTFSVFSTLSKPSIDGAILKYSPYYCWITDDYQKTVLANNIEEINKILDKYSLTDYLQDIFEHEINLKFYTGTPEENREMLEKIALAGAEIDALIGMTYDREYYSTIKDKYSTYTVSSNTIDIELQVEIYKKLENQDREEMVIDITTTEFSASDDTRWTAESLYDAMLKEIDSTDIAE